MGARGLTFSIMTLPLPPSLKVLLRDRALHRWVQRRRDRAILREWESAGRPLLPPQAFKQALIRQMAARHGIRVLVETGTNWGGTLAACLGDFHTLYSIELSDELFAAAQQRFARHRKVRLHHGNSANELPCIMEQLTEPALFWLDAHYSGDGTARADLDTPIVQELQTISRHPVSGHVILIDDARCFNGTNDYPTIENCRTLAKQFWPQHDFTVEADSIRITPQAMKPQVQ